MLKQHYYRINLKVRGVLSHEYFGVAADLNLLSCPAYPEVALLVYHF